MSLQVALKKYWHARQRGLDGYYLRVVGDLGVKVLRTRSQRAAVKEYLLNVAAAESGVTSEPLALSFNEGRYFIWMKHLEGLTLHDYAVVLGRKIQPQLTDEEELFSIGYNTPDFSYCLLQMDSICNKLQSLYNFSMCDHYDSCRNFIIQPDNSVKAIDFSQEVIEPEVFQKIMDKHKGALLRTMPSEPYLSMLRKEGIVA